MSILMKLFRHQFEHELEHFGLTREDLKIDWDKVNLHELNLVKTELEELIKKEPRIRELLNSNQQKMAMKDLMQHKGEIMAFMEKHKDEIQRIMALLPHKEGVKRKE